MKLDFLCNDGSPLGVTLTTLLGDDPIQIGTGGAEAALLTLCQALHLRGHDVRLYNNPRLPELCPFPQLGIDEFNPSENRDAVIIFRSPNRRIVGCKSRKIWWSCDQYTTDSFKEFETMVDEVVIISDFHAHYFKDHYGITRGQIIDLPVRTWEYDKPIEKVKHRCIWTSVPDRGLHTMLSMWPQVMERVPDASLVITSDYRLWGCGGAGNEPYLQRAIQIPGIQMLGAVKRDRLVEEQLKAEVYPYTCSYEELFCIACAEAQVAGAYPITPMIGALATTNMGKLIAIGPEFVDEVVNRLLDPELPSLQAVIRQKAMERFNVDRIVEEWEKRIFI